MKKILFFVGALVALFIVLLFIAGYKAEAIITAVKPQIEESLSTSLKTKVTLGRIHTRIFPETVLEVESLTMGEPGKSQVITLNNATLKASLLSLLGGTIAVHEFSLREPDVTVDFTASQEGPKVSTPTTEKITSMPKSNVESADVSPIQMKLDRLSIEHGRVTLKGLTPTDIVLSEINLSSNAGFDGNLASLKDFRIHATAFNEPLKIAADGIAIDIAKKRITPTNLSFEGLGGTIKVDGALEQGANSKAEASAEGFSIQKLLAAAKELAPGLAALQVSGTLEAKSAIALSSTDTTVVTSLNISAFGGTVTGTVSIKNEKDPKKLSTLSGHDVVVSNINIADALTGLAPAVPFKLFGTLDHLGVNITSDTANISAYSVGAFDFTVKDGGIKGINIIGETIQKIMLLPGIGQSMQTGMTPELKAIIAAQDTTFTSLAGQSGIKNKIVSIKSTKLESDAYSITIAGDYGLDGAMKLNTVVNFKAPITKALIASAKDFSKVVNPEDGTFTIPVIVAADAGGTPVVLPDINALSKTLAGKALVEAATKAIEKGLGKNSGLAKGLSKLF